MILFGFYELKCGYSRKETAGMLLEGVSKIKNILIIFGLIGALTAVWRISGTIPFILYYSVDLIKPEIFVLCTFLLWCLMSSLIGTSMGTAGTMGVICMMISNTLGINPLIIGGAVPIETIGAETGCLVYACYLYMLPVWNFIVGFKHRSREEVYTIAE